MKSIFRYISIWFILSGMLLSCEKEGIKVYDPERAAIEFTGRSGAYSFKTTGRTVDSVEILFQVEGRSVDRERTANFVVVADSTTATGNEYKILSATVAPQAYQGILKIEVRNTVGNDFEEVRLYLQTGSNEEFIPGVLAQQFYVFTITNKLVRPSGWTTWLERYYWGNYSTAYYEFIIGATGETNFPWPNAIPDYNDGKVWTNGEKDAFMELLKYKLKKRNEEVGSPLLHDDGTAKGKEVVVGKYYNM